jgi:choline dehydrogenase
VKDARYIWSRPPLGVVFMVDNPAVDWRYESEPDPTHGDRRIPVPRPSSATTASRSPSWRTG